MVGQANNNNYNNYLSVLEKLNFASLFLEILDVLTVRLSYFLDQFRSTFSNRNDSVKFQDLKISTKTLLFETYSIFITQAEQGRHDAISTPSLKLSHISQISCSKTSHCGKSIY